MSKAIFITGTGTDIGKTYVTGLIVKRLAESGASAAYYKAAMSPAMPFLSRIHQALPRLWRPCAPIFMTMPIPLTWPPELRVTRWKCLW